VEKDLELTIKVSIPYIVKWLENYLLRNGTNIQYLGEDADFNPYIRTPKRPAKKPFEIHEPQPELPMEYRPKLID